MFFYLKTKKNRSPNSLWDFKENNRGKEKEVVNFTISALLFETVLFEVELKEGNAIFQPGYILPSYSFPQRH